MEWIFYAWWLIPVAFIALSMLAGGYKLIGQPIVEAITRIAETRGAGQDLTDHPKIRELEQSIAALQQAMQNILEEQAFQHELLRSSNRNGESHMGDQREETKKRVGPGAA